MGLRRPAHALLLGLAWVTLACFTDGGPGSHGTTGGAAASGDTSEVPTASNTGGGTSEATGTSGDAASSGGASTSGVSTSGTGAPSCAVGGDACASDDECCGACLRCQDGVCAPSAAGCGVCERCVVDGSCEPADPGTPCGEPLQCADYVWGIDDEDCFAFAGVVTPTCTGGQVCSPALPQQCQEQGDVLAGCKGCLRQTHNCSAYAPAASITVDTMCVTNGPADTCVDYCTNQPLYSQIVFRECDAAGSCSHVEDLDCAGYKCVDDPPACLESCVDASDCLYNAACVNGVCGG